MLNQLVPEHMVVLHDRRIPRSSANIDHIVVGPSGIHVIDTKRYTGRVEVRSTGGIVRARVDQLVVNGRDKTALVKGMAKQIQVVSQVIKDLTGDDGPRISSILCFVDADWGLLTKPFAIDGSVVTWPKDLMKRLRRPGPLSDERIAELGERLRDGLRPAWSRS